MQCALVVAILFDNGAFLGSALPTQHSMPYFIPNVSTQVCPRWVLPAMLRRRTRSAIHDAVTHLAWGHAQFGAELERALAEMPSQTMRNKRLGEVLRNRDIVGALHSKPSMVFRVVPLSLNLWVRE